jgi:hypothetical protein
MGVPLVARARHHGRVPYARTAGGIGIALHLTVVAWLYLASGLVAPPSGTAVLLVLWLGLLAVAVLLWRERPAWALAVPVAAVGVWALTVTLGEVYLGWSA